MDALIIASVIIGAGFLTGFLVRDRGLRRRRMIERKLGL
jgi:hypothetical protein